MNANHVGLDQLKEHLARKYPRWHFWRANRGDGDLMATRKAHITGDLVDKGLARTLPLGLRGSIEEQLIEQDELAVELHV